MHADYKLGGSGESYHPSPPWCKPCYPQVKAEAEITYRKSLDDKLYLIHIYDIVSELGGCIYERLISHTINAAQCHRCRATHPVPQIGSVCATFSHPNRSPPLPPFFSWSLFLSGIMNIWRQHFVPVHVPQGLAYDLQGSNRKFSQSEDPDATHTFLMYYGSTSYWFIDQVVNSLQGLIYANCTNTGIHFHWSRYTSTTQSTPLVKFTCNWLITLRCLNLFKHSYLRWSYFMSCT